MSKDVKILGFKIYNKTKSECLEEVFKKEKVHIISGNPEVLYTACKNEVLRSELLLEDNIIIPDGIGVKLAGKIKGIKITKKIAGIELMSDIIDKCAELKYPVFLLGSTKEVVLKCAENLKSKNKDLIIAGAVDGFFNESQIDKIIDDINKSCSKVLFVAIGCPKQEKFIIKNKDKLNCKVLMGVGGSFDVISGKSSRAPRWMINLGLEWLFRVIREPKRVLRLVVIPKFLIKSLIYKDNA